MIRNTAFALLLGAALATVQQPVTLRHDLKENATEIYKLVTDMHQVVTIPSMGDQDMGAISTMTVTFKTSKMDTASGKLDYEMTLHDIENKGSGMLETTLDQAKDMIPKEIKLTGTIDNRNRITPNPVKTGTMMDMILGSASPTNLVLFVEFPEKPVGIGDSWPVLLPKNPIFGKEDKTLTAKLTGERDFRGTRAWAIEVGGVINIDADITEMLKQMPNNPAAGQKATLKGKINVAGTALVDEATGKTLQYISDMKSKTTTDLPDMGVSVDTDGTTKVTFTLQK